MKINDQELEAIENNIKIRLLKHIDDVISKEINRLLENKVNAYIDALLEGTAKYKLIEITKRTNRPNILYVHEAKEPPKEIRDFGVQEYRLPPIGPCVYFLCQNGRIVYIGQSINLSARIAQHSQAKGFDNVYYFNVPESLLNETEATLIDFYAPELNRTGVKNTKNGK
jgi:hypothetical protein